MSNTTKLIQEVFSYFDTTQKADQEKFKLTQFINNKLNDYITQGFSKSLAYEQVLEYVGGISGLIKAVEKRLGPSSYNDGNNTSIMQSYASELHLSDIKQFISTRLNLSVKLFFTYLLLGLGVTLFNYFMFSYTYRINFFNFQFESWVLATIIGSVFTIISMLLVILIAKRINSVNLNLIGNNFKLNQDNTNYVTALRSSFKNKSFLINALTIIIGIASTLLLIGFNINNIIIMIAIHFILFAIFIITSSYNKTLDLLLNEYEFYGNISRITSFIEQIAAITLPTTIIVNMVGIFVFDAVIEMLVSLSIVVGSLLVFILYYENARKITKKT